MWQAFLIALQFLTRLPVPAKLQSSPELLGKSVLTYPLVGLVIGGILLILQLLLQSVSATTSLVPAALILLVWVGLTGALHLDGLADSADAWLGGHGDTKRTLEIMKDPYCGPAGVTLVVLVLLIKFAALASILSHSWQAVLWVPVLGRAVVVALFVSTPYARSDGLGAVHAEHLPRTQANVVLLVVAMITLVLLGKAGVVVLLAVLGAGFLLRQLMQKRLGGTTGDTAGALIEITETSALVMLAL